MNVRRAPCSLHLRGVALAVLLGTAGCAARSDIPCEDGVCPPNPASFWIEVSPPPNATTLETQEWILSATTTEGVLPPFEAYMVPAIQIEGTVLQNVAGTMPLMTVGLMDVDVTASRTDPITDEPVVASATTDSTGAFTLSLRPEPTALIHLTLKAPAALGLPPIVLDGTPAELAELPPSAFTFLAAEEYFQVLGEVLLDDGAGLASPLPNVRVRVLVVGPTGAAEPLGVTAITDCLGQFLVRLPPATLGTGQYRLRVETLEAGATPACSSAPVCSECAGQCVGSAGQAPVIGSFETIPGDIMSPLADIVVSAPGPESRTFIVPGTASPAGMGLCPPPVTALTASFDDGMNEVREDMLGTASVTFASTDLPDYPDGSFTTTIPTSALIPALMGTGTFGVVLPWGTYDVSIDTGSSSLLASKTLSYTTLNAMVTDTRIFTLEPKVEVVGVILDSAGIPIAEALVEARPAGDPNGGDPEWTVTTGVDGAYTLVLSPGPDTAPRLYDLTIRAAEHAPWIERYVEVVESTGPLSYPPIDLMMPSLLTGHVLDAGTMLPLENAQVTVYLKFFDGADYSVGYPLGSAVTTSMMSDRGSFKFLLPNPGDNDPRRCLLVACD